MKSNEYSDSYYEENESQTSTNISNQYDKISKIKSNYKLMYPIGLFVDLSEENQVLVEQAEKDPEKQLEVGKNLIKGKNGFTENISLGIQYIINSIKQNCLNSIAYYSKFLIKNCIFSEILPILNKYLNKFNEMNDSRAFLIQGLMRYEDSKFDEAADFFKKGSELGEPECTYKYGIMHFIGDGVKKDDQKALKFVNESKDKGYEKSDYFLRSLHSLNEIKEFSKLSPHDQLIFINNNIKNLTKNEQPKSQFDQLILKPKKTEKLFFNESLKSPSFIEFLKHYKNVSIEIGYPSSSFKSIINLVVKIKSKKLSSLNIGVVFSSFSEPFIKQCFLNDISYHRVGLNVEFIPSRAFKNNSLLKQIIIPSTIEIIGDSAFEGCSSLKQITIPPSVYKINISAFKNCSSLKQIIIPPSVTEIYLYAFKGCSSLERISLPPLLTDIGRQLFKGCLKLKQITIPSSVTEVSEEAFYGVKSLEIIGDLKIIFVAMFSSCSSLKSITIPSSVIEISCCAFKDCKSLKQITIPPSVTTIGYCAFKGCSSLTKINIPSSVIEIGGGVFTECNKLVNINIESDNEARFTLFEGKFLLGKSDQSYEIFDTFISIVLSVDTVIFPSFIKKISEYAFYECSCLKHITIPSPIEQICDYTFYYCESLRQIKIDSSVTKIGKSAFICSLLKEITIPSSVTEIGPSAFFQCLSLKKVTISESVAKIGSDAFYGCTSLTQVIFMLPSSLNIIEKSTFHECSSLKEITIPSSVTVIGDSAFYDCKSLKKITIPSSVRYLGFDCFEGCSSLMQIAIPSYLINDQIGLNSKAKIIKT